MPNPDQPRPLSELLADPDSPSPLRDQFLKSAAGLFTQAEGERGAMFAGVHAGEVRVPVRGTYAAIEKNGHGLLLAADIQMSGIAPHAELKQLKPLEFELVGYTILPNLMNLCIVTAAPVGFTPGAGQENVRVHDSTGVVEVKIRPLIIVDETVR